MEDTLSYVTVKTTITKQDTSPRRTGKVIGRLKITHSTVQLGKQWCDNGCRGKEAINMPTGSSYLRTVPCFLCRNPVSAASWDDVWYCAGCWRVKYSNRSYQSPPNDAYVPFRPYTVLGECSDHLNYQVTKSYVKVTIQELPYSKEL